MYMHLLSTRTRANVQKCNNWKFYFSLVFGFHAQLTQDATSKPSEGVPSNLSVSSSSSFSSLGRCATASFLTSPENSDILATLPVPVAGCAALERNGGRELVLVYLFIYSIFIKSRLFMTFLGLWSLDVQV